MQACIFMHMWNIYQNVKLFVWMDGKPLRFQCAYEAAKINDVTELDDEPNIIDDDYVNSLIVASSKAPELKAHCKRKQSEHHLFEGNVDVSRNRCTNEITKQSSKHILSF
jgi:hypothetical protein